MNIWSKDVEEMSREELIDCVKTLRSLYNESREELEKLKIRNPRGAGRKLADDKWAESFSTFSDKYAEGGSPAEIMESCGISRSTYYRYKKLYDDIRLNN